MMTRKPKKGFRKRPQGMFKGSRIRVPYHPPEIVTLPWFNLTVRHQASGAIVGTDNLAAALRLQLFGAQGPATSSLGITVRINKVRVWGDFPPTASSSGFQPLIVRVLDLVAQRVQVTGSTDVLAELTDYPDRVSRPAVGYAYGEPQNGVVIHWVNVQQNMPLLLVNQPGVLVYWDIALRFTGDTALPPSGWEFLGAAEELRS